MSCWSGFGLLRVLAICFRRLKGCPCQPEFNTIVASNIFDLLVEQVALDLEDVDRVTRDGYGRAVGFF